MLSGGRWFERIEERRHTDVLPFVVRLISCFVQSSSCISRRGVLDAVRISKWQASRQKIGYYLETVTAWQLGELNLAGETL